MTNTPLTPTYQDILDSLGLDSHTANRLQHASPEHLNLTTRRCFIGPIPQGWLKTHRRNWYKHHLGIHYSSRAATFSAGPEVGRHRRLTGLEAPRALAEARQSASFPQPEDVDEEGAEEYGENEDTLVKKNSASVVTKTWSSQLNDTVVSPEEAPELEGIETPRQSAHPAYTPLSFEESAFSVRTKSKASQPTTGTSFTTAKESLSEHKLRGTSSAVESGSINSKDDGEQDYPVLPSDDGASTAGNGTPRLDAQTSEPSSTTSLLNHSTTDLERADQPERSPSKGILAKVRDKLSHGNTDVSAHESAAAIEVALHEPEQNDNPQQKKMPARPVQFKLPNREIQQEEHVKDRIAQMRIAGKGTIRRGKKHKVHDGEVVKLEQMLVRVEFTTHELTKEYNENDSQKIESRTLGKWKEYMVVCRETEDDDMDFVLQLYKSRVIPAVEKIHVKRPSAHTIYLSRKKKTNVNLYSSLDKTIVLWHPSRRGTLIYIMQPQSGVNSMEWYTFLRNVLGWKHGSQLQVNVPDLDVRLRLDQPFAEVEEILAAAISRDDSGEGTGVIRTIGVEQAAAAHIIRRCMQMLEKSPEWGDVRASLERNGGKVGLAWKRYDRLEWVHGANERKMYGAIGMEKSHDLELRPKEHYATAVPTEKNEVLMEPAPVEGFLIRLTSKRGVDQKMGRLFYKRLYFSTHNQFMVYNLPSKADPPPPPRFSTQDDSKVPTASEIASKIPLIYSVTPYPIQDGQIKWLSRDKANTAEERALHDKDAAHNDERNANLVLDCDGCIDLCNVVRVRKVQRGATPADQNVGPGSDSDVDFDEEVPDSHQDDGTTTHLDDDRTFEMVMRNGLVMRLQAFDTTTKREWMTRLRALTTYWSLRIRLDTNLYKSVRAQNLARLNIDEDTEAFMGQFAQKWEVSKSYASAAIYNMCGVSGCRAVQMSGVLYRKPRLHGDFERNLVMLCKGRLLVFRDGLRRSSGAMVPHIHNEKIESLDLGRCYVYSGLVTEGDLLYTSQGAAGTRPGHAALPRMYLEDGWSSIDEDTMTTFVVWHEKRRSWFRSEDDARGQRRGGRLDKKLKLVSQLGVEGRIVVFKARSRAERDHWVLSIATEI